MGPEPLRPDTHLPDLPPRYVSPNAARRRRAGIIAWLALVNAVLFWLTAFIPVGFSSYLGCTTFPLLLVSLFLGFISLDMAEGRARRAAVASLFLHPIALVAGMTAVVLIETF